jgi:glyoxylate/hydroxypyruvate reductase A
MTILFAAQLPADEHRQWLTLLCEAMPEETVRTERSPQHDADVDIAVVARPAPGALQGLPGLRLVQSLWAGVDGLLRDATIPADVPLARMVDPAMNTAMAETALWAVLSLHRRFTDYAVQQQRGQWLQHAQQRADEIAVAVLGLGEMGRTVAWRLAANGYRVLGWSRRPASIEGVVTQHGDDTLAPALRDADIVINLLPLTPHTAGLFNAERFAQMKRGAAFVNLARGAQVVDADLLAALDSGALRHAVLDVFHTEPLPREHAFWSHPQVTLLPHVAAATDPRSAVHVVAANVRALREGRAAAHLVDRQRGY